MSFFRAFIWSGVLAVIASIAILQAMIPPGEGSFGIAKEVPSILSIFILLCFCFVWFPANLIVWFRAPPEERTERLSDAKAVLFASGGIFTFTLLLVSHHLVKLRSHRVDLYYEIKDQMGRPIPGVRIRRHNDYERWDRDTELRSDDRGSFKTTCNQGQSFTLTPKKQGYVLASPIPRGAYSEEMRQKRKLAQTTTNTPTVIKMWKLQGAEPLVSIDRDYSISFTNVPINFDLLQGITVSNGGDLRLIVNRPDGIISQQHPQNWSIKLEVIGGGFMEVPDNEWGITYFAPKEGYHPSDVLRNDNGSDMIRRGLFIQSRSGQIYSKLGLSFRINNKPIDFMYLTFSGVANTNSSRNWEATAQ